MDARPKPPLSPRRRRVVRVGLLAAGVLLAAGGLYVVAAVPPADSAYYPKCNFYQLTGLHCPGCGLTRSLHAALNGRLAQAVAYNALAPVLLPVVVLAVARPLWSLAWGSDAPRREKEPRRWVRWAPWVMLGVLIGFWVLRNVPAYPFTLLAPHEL